MARPRRGLRVIAGSAKGRRLDAPPGLGTRPVTDRVKESIFGSLGAAVEGARVLDLYAGSGALAIEALSRGAASALLVERDRRGAEVAAANLERAGCAGVAEVRRGDVPAVLRRGRPPTGEGFDLVFCDPPFDLATPDLERVLGALPEWTAPDALVVLRRRAGEDPPALPPGWQFRRERIYGDTLVLVVTTT